MRQQLRAAVAADGGQAGVAGTDALFPGADQNAVGQFGARRDQGFDIDATTEAGFQQSGTALQQLPGLGDGAAVGAGRCLDQPRPGGGKVGLGIVGRNDLAHLSWLGVSWLGVKISAPFSVIRTVCSHCADSEWSLVTTVHSSGSTFTWRLPALTIGSMVSVMPGFNVTPWPGWP